MRLILSKQKLIAILGNGYIEGEELDLFLKEFVTSVLSENHTEESKEVSNHNFETLV